MTTTREAINEPVARDEPRGRTIARADRESISPRRERRQWAARVDCALDTAQEFDRELWGGLVDVDAETEEPDRPPWMPERIAMTETVSGADAILAILRAHNVDCAFASPIAVMAPLWEALRRRREPDTPRYFRCRHESLAVSLASG